MNNINNEMTKLLPLYFEGKLDAEQTREVESWMAASDDNQAIADNMARIYRASDMLFAIKNSDADSALESVNGRIRHTRLHILFIRMQRVAALLFIPLLMVSLLQLYNALRPRPVQMMSISTNPGMTASATLPDGTKVKLNSDSRLSYPATFTDDNRKVSLRGEAYFNVAKEKDKPFIVKVDGQQIEALGTKFNVMAYPADTVTVTTLLEGSVRLFMEQGGQISILKPNQQHIYNKNKQRVLVKDVDASQYTAWTTGYYYFPEQTMESMLGRLANLYGVTFDVQTASLNQRKFTGTLYRGQRIEDIMEIISLSIPIRYKVNDHHITIIKK